MPQESIKKARALLKMDADRPTLGTFFALEIFKWGTLLVAFFLMYSCTRPLLHPLYIRARYIISGDEHDREMIERKPKLSAEDTEEN